MRRELCAVRAAWATRMGEVRASARRLLQAQVAGAAQAAVKTIKSHYIPSNPKVFESFFLTTEAERHRGLGSRPPGRRSERVDAKRCGSRFVKLRQAWSDPGIFKRCVPHGPATPDWQSVFAVLRRDGPAARDNMRHEHRLSRMGKTLEVLAYGHRDVVSTKARDAGALLLTVMTSNDQRNTNKNQSSFFDRDSGGGRSRTRTRTRTKGRQPPNPKVFEPNKIVRAARAATEAPRTFSRSSRVPGVGLRGIKGKLKQSTSVLPPTTFLWGTWLTRRTQRASKAFADDPPPSDFGATGDEYERAYGHPVLRRGGAAEGR